MPNRTFRNVFAWGFIFLFFAFVFRNRLPIIHSFLYHSVGTYCELIDIPLQINEPDLKQYNNQAVNYILGAFSVLFGMMGFAILVIATAIGLYKIFYFIQNVKPRKIRILTPVREMRN